MAPLVLYAAVQRGDAEGSERRGPVGNGKPRVVAGDQGTGNDENKSRARDEDGEAMVCAIVRCAEGLQTCLQLYFL
jgi:hypothetical protein